MKNYKVTVNGNTYEVGVEEVGGVPEVKSVQAAAPASKPGSAPKAAPVPQAHAAGTEDIVAPLPGTVISVNVAEGDPVKAGQVLLIFEAMKMENELVAPRDGTVVKVHVAKGDVLESNKAVITLS